MPTEPFETLSYKRCDPAFRPDLALMNHGNLVTGTYAEGTVLGPVTASPGTYKAYATGNSDGSQTATRILRWPCTVDADGNITIEGASDFKPTQESAEMYISGFFRTQDLVGLDAAGLADMGGQLVSGTLANGVIKF